MGTVVIKTCPRGLSAGVFCVKIKMIVYISDLIYMHVREHRLVRSQGIRKFSGENFKFFWMNIAKGMFMGHYLCYSRIAVDKIEQMFYYYVIKKGDWLRNGKG